MLFYLGVLLLAGFVGGKLANRLKLPAVTGYIVAGVIVGPSLFNIIPTTILDQISVIEGIALSIIALAIGGELRVKTLQRLGKSVLIITLFQGVAAFLVVLFGIRLAGGTFSLGLLLGALATATAPAATLAVIKEYKARGDLTNTLLAVVALDDVLCIVIFSFVVAFVKVLSANVGFSVVSLLAPMGEVIFSLLIGGLLGVLTIFLVKKIKKTDILIAILGIGLLAYGLAEFLNLSALLTNMMLGAVISNLSNREELVFAQLRTIEPPIYLMFFTFAGTALNLSALTQVGLLGLAYIGGRIIGKVGGAYLGARLCNSPKNIQKYLGLGLLPQAGVAIGLAVMASNQFPAMQETIMTVTLASIVVFEIIGPMAAKVAVFNSGEANVGESKS